MGSCQAKPKPKPKDNISATATLVSQMRCYMFSSCCVSDQASVEMCVMCDKKNRLMNELRTMRPPTPPIEPPPPTPPPTPLSLSVD